MPYLDIPKGTFGTVGIDELEERLNLGVVEFKYIYTTDTGEGVPGQIRTAIGTRNLGLSIVPFDEIPLGVRTPPDHVLTYYDFVRAGWRCFNRSALVDYSTDIYIENNPR